ncbi:MAG: thiamine phosphate synthase [Clostridia bacterium]|nr:thiamine phosphate synthase [Clostridia bacterium]
MIIFVTSLEICEQNKMLGKIREAALLGVDYILLREPQLSPEAYENLALIILQIIGNTKTELIIAHHKNIAEKLKLKYHVSFHAFDEHAFSVSIHRKEELKHLRLNQYALFSVAFETSCKPGKKPLDWTEYGAKNEIIALGGITFENAGLLKNYVNHVAMMSSWLLCENLSSRIKHLKCYY